MAALVALSACTEEEPYMEGWKDVHFDAEIEQQDKDGTRLYVQDEDGVLQLHWTALDEISIFFSTYNEQFIFQGNTADTGGRFDPASSESLGNSFTTGFEIDRYYAVYPYAEATSLSGSVLNYEFPATQAYAPDSFGLGASVMVAVTSGPGDRHLTFKTVTGFLKLKIYGGATIQSIVLRGNDGQILSGPAAITAPYGDVPSTVMTGDGTSITLTCPGVTTGATKDEATAFWIALPPTDFPNGFTVEITDTKGRVMTKSKGSAVSVRRNHMVPMAAFEFAGVEPEPEIPDLPVIDSGLPVLYVYTPDGVAVDQKETWISGSTAYLKDTDGSITSLGAASIRGRGNTTWNYVKKPYAFKLDKKASLLGMPKDKRWDLLANYLDRTRLRNDLALELGRRLSTLGLDWTPKGKYVELVLNNVHMGNYYLCEHIKGAEKRVPIQEMTAADEEGDAITGGYLLEFGIEMDEPRCFWTNGFTDVYPYNRHGKWDGNYHLPVMVKEPEADVMTDTQFNWLKDYINNVEYRIAHGNGTWRNDVDMDSFLCWMFVQEVVGNYEPFHPKSAYMHKDRGGKLMMGPLWDFDYGTFKDGYVMMPVYHYSIWYPYMLRDGVFKARAKELWPLVRAVMVEVRNEYAVKFTQATSTPESMALAVSIDRDWARWSNIGEQPEVNGDESLGIWVAFKKLTDNLSRRISQMDGEVDGF